MRFRVLLCAVVAVLPIWVVPAAGVPVPEPVMVPLATGSTLATWTMAGEGARRHSTPVVFLHGGPGLYTEARRFDEGAVLRAAGFDTIYFDQAGGGRSALLKAGEYSLERAIADLEALRIALRQEQLVLWGNSYGATLLALYADRYPGRVAGVLLTSPGMFPGFAGKRDYGRTDRDKVVYDKAVMAAIKRIDRDGGAAEAVLPQPEAGKLFDALVADELVNAMVCKGSSVRPAALPGGGNLFAQRLIDRDLKALKFTPAGVGSVQKPTLIVRGSCDYVPAVSAERFRAVFGGTIVDVPDSGHGLLENRAVVVAAMDGFARGALDGVK